jgi:hypothetical protein
MCALISLQLLYDTFLIIKRTGRDMIKHISWSSCAVPSLYIGLHVQYRHCILVFMYSTVTVYWSSCTVPSLYIGLHVQYRHCILIFMYSTVTVYWSSRTVPSLYVGLHVQYPLFLSDFNETRIFPSYFGKIFKYQISLKSVQWKRVIPCGQTDMMNSKFFRQQMHSLLKYKTIQLTLKISLCRLLHISVRSDHHQGAYAEPC